MHLSHASPCACLSHTSPVCISYVPLVRVSHTSAVRISYVPLVRVSLTRPLCASHTCPLCAVEAMLLHPILNTTQGTLFETPDTAHRVLAGVAPMPAMQRRPSSRESQEREVAVTPSPVPYCWMGMVRSTHLLRLGAAWQTSPCTVGVVHRDCMPSQHAH